MATEPSSASGATDPASLPATMRVAVYVSTSTCPEGVRVVDDRKVPRLKSSSLLCRTRAFGVNPVDSKFQVGDKLPGVLQGCGRWFVRNQVVGFDFAGEVVEAPAGSGFKPGDPVFGTMPPLTGSFADYICVPLHQVFHKPEALSFVEAAALPLGGLTCVQSFEQHGLCSGQRLLVIGASGGVGHLAVQIASAMGVTVTGVCSAKNVEFVRSLGAKHVVDYTDKDTDVITALQRIAKQDGAFHMVLDTVSSLDSRDAEHAYEPRIRRAQDPAIILTPQLAKKQKNSEEAGAERAQAAESGEGARADDGGVPAAAATTPPRAEHVDKHNYVTIGGGTSSWMVAGLKRVAGINLFSSGHELFWVRFPHSRPELERLHDLVSTHRIRPNISHVLNFDSEGLQEAFRLLNSRHVQGKVVIASDPSLLNHRQEEEEN